MATPVAAPVTTPVATIDHHRIPSEILSVCQRLRDGGFGAYLVGGAVRDLLRSPTATAKDFDLTTSARPEQVIQIFGPRRTIPTGIEHGTVTVLCDPQPPEKPGPARPVEITTFRGEVGFSDGRRPDRVEFITDLTEDLRRRDFTINAIAYEPLTRQLIDPFGGRADLGAGILRAVGDPVARFAEDGLRVMRAVRFAAQLEFAVEPATRTAFAGALPTLRKVSRERVRDELLKLLAAPRPTCGLRLLVERSDEDPTGDWGVEGSLLKVVLPEVAAVLQTLEQARVWWWVVELAAPAARLGAVLWPMRHWLTEAGAAVAKIPVALPELLDERLKLPLRQRQHLCGLLQLPLRLEPPGLPALPGTAIMPRTIGRADAAGISGTAGLPVPAGMSGAATMDDPLRSEVAVRRLLAGYSFELLDELLQLRGFELLLTGQLASGDLQFRLRERLRAELARRPPLQIGELAISGKDLLTELGLKPGPQIGVLLAGLLDAVLIAPARNERSTLLQLARQLAAGAAPQ